MKMKRALAIALCAGLAFGGVQPIAEAGVQKIPGGVWIENDSKTEGFAISDLAYGSKLTTTFQNPQSVGGLLESSLQTVLTVDGRQVAFLPTETKSDVEENEIGYKVILTHYDANTEIQITRTIEIGTNSMDVTVEATNKSKRDRKIDIEMFSAVPKYAQYQGTYRGGRFNFGPAEKPGYDVSVNFRGADVSKAAGHAIESGEASRVGEVAEDGAGYQYAAWNKELPVQGTASVTANIFIQTQPTAKDTDQDGLPDEWEKVGFTAADGTPLPLDRWGAKVGQKDLFLQLNWMKSEWETLNCNEVNKFGANIQDFEKFAKCAEANANVYRPSRESLMELEDKFAAHGIRLHIDAGDLYTSIPNYENRHGGPTEDFTPLYFADGMSKRDKLGQKRQELLGTRESVFRVGIIGDQMEKGDWSTGTGLVNDSAFYVSYHENVTNQEQLRNTILHEFGHNLGLTHNGALSTNPVDTEAYLPTYKSVMNYLYQWSHFDYSDQAYESVPKTDKRYPKEKCEQDGVVCYEGEYSVPADWDNLNLKGKYIGSGEGTVGTDDIPEPSHNISARELEIIAADQNPGKAGFRLAGGEDAAVVTNRSTDVLTGEIRNLGLDLHKFTVYAKYPTITGAEPIEVTVPGQINASGAEPSARVEIPIKNATSLRDSTMPLEIRIVNAEGDEVFKEEYQVSVLDYTAEEMERIRKEIEKDPTASDRLKESARRILDPKAGRQAPEEPDRIDVETPKPQAPPTDTGVNTGQSDKSSASDNVGMIVGIIAAVGGVLAAVYAAAWASGLLKF
ncbi:hypothetical protein JMN37_04160 [Corynebacterium sp. MC-18]|uniref:Uncharacterized protein n=2 Tax=Corynebacterium lipophilum TaxID=2804918 RepID=A0AAW5HS42_9CORY|nr:hypothetical protein [Corynebacterium lipophilum]